MCREWIAGIFLIICSWQDIREKIISGKVLLLFGTGGLIANMIFQIPWQQWIGGLVLGVLLLLLGKISEQQIGYGDGMAVMVVGLFISWKEILAVLLVGLFLCAISSIIVFFLGKWKRNLRMPFLPFLAAGFGIQLLF